MGPTPRRRLTGIESSSARLSDWFKTGGSLDAEVVRIERLLALVHLDLDCRSML